MTGKCLQMIFQKLKIKPRSVKILYNNIREIDIANSIIAHMGEYGKSLDTISSFLGCESEAVIAISETSTDRVLEMVSRARLVGILVTMPSAAVNSILNRM